MATKKSVWVTLGVVMVLAAWEISGTMVEHRNVLHEEGADEAQPVSARPGATVRPLLKGDRQAPADGAAAAAAAR